MLLFEFNDIQIPLTCITGLSYSKSGNIVDRSNLSCKCLGINPIQVQVQISLSMSTCVDNDIFEYLARELSQIRPIKGIDPSYIAVGGKIIIPQMKFMLTSTNITYQSDRLGRLQEVNVNWTLSGSRVVKDENRNVELKGTDEDPLLPNVKLHCKGKTVDCSQDISVADLRLSGFKGSIQLVLGDTYKEVDRDAWLADVTTSKDTYFEIEGYGKFYIFQSYIIADNWINFELTKFSKEWFQNRTETFISDSKLFGLNDVFANLDVSSKAKFAYLKFDDSPINMLYKLQDSLGYLIGLRNDSIYLYDVPKNIPRGQVTYDYVLDNDTMTAPITKVIIRDGQNEFVSGNDDGETFFVNAECRVTSEASDNVLRYAQFNQNMLILTIPLETRINIGSIVNVNTGESIVPCVVTEYDISFIDNSMTIELHYITRN